MLRWYRVFGANATVPTPADIQRCLADAGVVVSSSFQEDATGWFCGELRVGYSTIFIDRWLPTEEGIRAELNSWAAFLETCEHSPLHAALMERVIQTQQLLVFQAEGIAFDCLARHLARVTEGVFYVDGAGFFAADGSVLVEER
jgi:hypothetical protein